MLLGRLLLEVLARLVYETALVGFIIMTLMAYDNRLSANLTQRLADIQLQWLLADGVGLPAKRDENIVFVFAGWKKSPVHQLLCTGKLGVLVLITILRLVYPMHSLVQTS